MDNSAETITLNNLWEVIASHQGETFYTKKMLPFTYTIKGGEMFTDRRERSINRSKSPKHVRRTLCMGSVIKSNRYM